MIQTLPLALFIVMTELAIGAFTVLFLLDWRNQVKRGFLITYAVIYLLFTGLTYLFEQNFSPPDLLNSFGHLDRAWTGYLPTALLLFLVLMIPYTFLLFFDRRAGVDGKEKAKKEGQKPGSPFRVLRLITGSLALLDGMATILVLAMIYRPLAAVNVAGALTVAEFFAATLALGGVMTAMWLGHWYLVTPALSEKPYLFLTTLVLIAILAQIVLTLTAGPTLSYTNTTQVVTATPGSTIQAATPTTGPQVKPLDAPVTTPLGVEAINWLRVLVSFIMPLIFGGLAWKLIRDRSFQSATGMLYLVFVLVLAGEAIARGLFLIGL